MPFQSQRWNRSFVRHPMKQGKKKIRGQALTPYPASAHQRVDQRKIIASQPGFIAEQCPSRRANFKSDNEQSTTKDDLEMENKFTLSDMIPQPLNRFIKPGFQRMDIAKMTGSPAEVESHIKGKFTAMGRIYLRRNIGIRTLFSHRSSMAHNGIPREQSRFTCGDFAGIG